MGGGAADGHCTRLPQHTRVAESRTLSDSQFNVVISSRGAKTRVPRQELLLEALPALPELRCVDNDAAQLRELRYAARAALLLLAALARPPQRSLEHRDAALRRREHERVLRFRGAHREQEQLGVNVVVLLPQRIIIEQTKEL